MLVITKVSIETKPYVIQVDNSPPSSGAFAVSTEHAARLVRHRDSWMTYDNDGIPSLKLAWLGFGDPHCSIAYIVKIGTSIGLNDLITVRFGNLY